MLALEFKDFGGINIQELKCLKRIELRFKWSRYLNKSIEITKLDRKKKESISL
jgi:hypothetical protein